MTAPLTTPKVDSDGWMVASIAGSTPNSVVIDADHCNVARSINIVREAFEASVAKTPPSTPPLNHHTNQESTVAKLGELRWSMWPPSRNQCILDAEKYGSSTSPVVERTDGVSPRASSS